MTARKKAAPKAPGKAPAPTKAPAPAADDEDAKQARQPVREKLPWRWMKTEEVCARYAVNRTTIDRWIERDGFPEGVIFGGRLRMWDERELDEYDEMKRKARDAAREMRRAKRREREERETMKARGEDAAQLSAGSLPVASSSMD